VNKAHLLTQVVLTIIEVLPNLSLNLDQSRFDSCPVASVGRLQDAVTNLALLEFHNNLFIATHSLLLAPQNPIFQRPLKLTSQNTYNFSYIGWKWNGQAIFEYNTSNNLKYRLQFTNTPSLVVSGTNTLPTLHGNVTQNLYGQCVGDPAPSTNKIDGLGALSLNNTGTLNMRHGTQQDWTTGRPSYNPAVYNPAFIRLCYEILLRRAPDEIRL
jgi:hypothetical protein